MAKGHLLGVLFKRSRETSLVVQRLKIHLPVQRTQVQFQVEQDPTCHRAINY